MVEHNHDEERLARVEHIMETLARETATLRVETAILAVVTAVIEHEAPWPRRRKADARGG